MHPILTSIIELKFPFSAEPAHPCQHTLNMTIINLINLLQFAASNYFPNVFPSLVFLLALRARLLITYSFTLKGEY